MFDIYKFFNSRDIAEHCRSIDHEFTGIEMAYIIWHSRHNTLEEKCLAWQEIIDTVPDETFPANWDLDGHTLHSFLRTYMRLLNDFIEDFCTSKEQYIYVYSTLDKCMDEYFSGKVFYDSYEACFDALKTNEVDDDPDNEIESVKITRIRVYKTRVNMAEAEELESVIFDKQLRVLDIEADTSCEGEKRFLAPCNGFYDMWVAIPTPFRRGDIVTDINVYTDGYPKKHMPFVLDRLPYWRKNAENGDDCTSEVERLLALGVDITDMQEGVYFQDDLGEAFWDHAFSYLDLEYYRDELVGKERFLKAMSSAIQGKISVEDLLRSHSIILMENHAGEMRKYVGCNGDYLKLCGLDNCERESK